MIVTPGGVELSPVERPPASDGRHFEYDPDATVAGMAVVAALSEVLQADPTTLEPLQRTIDVDALDTLLSSSDAVEVTFPFADRTVTVTADGVITVRPAPSASHHSQDLSP